MPQLDPFLLTIGILVSAVLLVIGGLIGYLAARGKALRMAADQEKHSLATQQQLTAELALAQQREQQLRDDLGRVEANCSQLTASLETSRNQERELAAQVSRMEQRVEAEAARTQDKAEQLAALHTQRQTLEEELRQRHELVTGMREKLGQSQEQALQLTELKARCGDLQANLQRANEQLNSQSEQLGQALEQKQQLETALGRCRSLEADLKSERESLSQERARYAKLSMEREKDLQAAEEKLQLLQQNKDHLKQEFENLANQIFEGKQQSFGEQSRQSLDALLKPFKEQLESFRHRVDQVHSESVSGHSSMKSELAKLMELNARITTEASNLTKALKGDKKLQGTWGEQKVELLLEQAGLRKGVEYEREPNYKDDDAQNRRPDFVVQLPEGKHIIIDSKVSLVDFTTYVSAETDEERTTALAAHVNALRNHIDGLAGKKYPELSGMNSPDFVFLFIPVEPAYLVAAEHSPALFQAAYEKRIAIVTATTLLPVLRVAANLWTIQRQNQNTRQLAEQATRVYDKLRVFVEKMEKLGNQISTVQRTYNDSFNTLREGNGSLTKTVDRFVELGVKVIKRLPASVAADPGDTAEPVEEGLLLTDESLT